ncbi:MAG: phage Gp37/Gp68 family protein, partial [Blastocatellia bacterium]|nr:phage Gp37/Gp68 family protein [Blastocatellia bacterium]MBX7224316.1 phage Gp37/Gp68 family protein [Blastocatellia bacterium]
MGENTKIEWAHHTFNPWVGCAKVSEGCRNCYAEALAKRGGLA